MMRKLAEFAGQQVLVLGGARGTMLQPERLSAADCRRDGRHRDPAGEPGLLILTHPDTALRTRRHRLRPERLAVATGTAEHDRYAKTLTASASLEEP